MEDTMKPEDTLKVLEMGRQIIANSQNWTKGAYQRNHNFEIVQGSDPQACKFCSVGAVFHAARILAIPAPSRFRPWYMLDKAAGGSITAVNDDPTTTHEQILAIWDAAIEWARAEAAEGAD